MLGQLIMFVVAIGLLVQILLHTQVPNERNTIPPFDDMIALDVFLNHVNLGIKRLHDEQLKVEFLEQIEQELGKFIIRLAEHFVHCDQTEGFCLLASDVDPVLVCDGRGKYGRGKTILFSDRAVVRKIRGQYTCSR